MNAITEYTKILSDAKQFGCMGLTGNAAVERAYRIQLGYAEGAGDKAEIEALKAAKKAVLA